MVATWSSWRLPSIKIARSSNDTLRALNTGGWGVVIKLDSVAPMINDGGRWGAAIAKVDSNSSKRISMSIFYLNPSASLTFLRSKHMAIRRVTHSLMPLTDHTWKASYQTSITCNSQTDSVSHTHTQ